MLGPGIIGQAEFDRRKAAGEDQGRNDNLAINTLGPGVVGQSAEHTLVQFPPQEGDDLRVSAKTALKLLKKDAHTVLVVMTGELSRAPATRRISVLQGILDVLPATETERREKVIAALQETHVAQQGKPEEED